MLSIQVLLENYLHGHPWYVRFNNVTKETMLYRCSARLGLLLFPLDINDFPRYVSGNEAYVTVI